MKSPQRIAAEQIAIAGLAIAGVIGLAFGAGAILGKLSGPRSDAPERVPNAVRETCRDEIRARLKYPATAEFEWRYEGRIEAGQYMVWETFTAKNAFGVQQSMRGMCIFPPGPATKNPEVSIG